MKNKHFVIFPLVYLFLMILWVSVVGQVQADIFPVADRTPQVRDAIVAAAGVNSAADVTEAHLTAVKELFLDRKGITSLKSGDFDGLTNLTVLRLRYNSISDISALSGLTNLRDLRLTSNSISDISALSGLTNLTTLVLYDNSISDISALSGLTNLTQLALSINSISDISALSGLTNLTWLSLYDNSISDISALSGLTNLTFLDLHDNSISDISDLSGLKSLTRLHLSINSISDISALSDLENLIHLGLRENSISDISDLSGLTNLTQLFLWGNSISDISALSDLKSLTHLFLRENSISDISDLSGLTNLTTLSLNDNSISDISALSGLTNLTTLHLWENSISDISALSGLTNLTTLFLRENSISDYGPLRTLVAAIKAAGRSLRLDITIPAPTLTAFPVSPLTEGTLNGSIITLTLSGAKYKGKVGKIRNAVSVSGITGVTLPKNQLKRRSNTEITAKVVFDGTDFDTDSTLTFTIEAGAIADYTGPAFTAEVAVSAVTETVVASTKSPLTERTLNGSTITLTLSGAKYKGKVREIRDAVSVSGITGVTLPKDQPKRRSNTKITAKVTFNGDMTTDGILTFTVGADAIAGYNGPDLTAQITVTANSENALLPNFPNPFNPETWIPYQLSKPADVTLIIYGVDGQVVRRLALGHHPAGMYQSRSSAAYWDGRNMMGEPVASGLYFYTLTAGDFTATRKMLIRK